MSEALADRGAGEVEDLTASDLLATIKASRQVENAEAARQLILAAQWADLHPPESIHKAATFSVPSAGGEHEEPIAGEGCPLVAEFCIAELGGVLGASTVAAKKLIGQALELRHRLPRLWALVHVGRVPAWKARAVAETTIHLLTRAHEGGGRFRRQPGRRGGREGRPRAARPARRRSDQAVRPRRS